MRARPTLSNPLSYTSVAQLPALSGVVYSINGGGRDVYISIPQKIQYGIKVSNARRVVVLSCHIQFPKGKNGNAEAVTAYSGNMGLRFSGIKEIIHVEGCIVDVNYNFSDCIAIDSSLCNVQVQATMLLHSSSRLDGVGTHGDCIHAQGGGPCEALYIEYCHLEPAFQGLQTIRQIPTKTGVNYLSVKNTIMTRRYNEWQRPGGRSMNAGSLSGDTDSYGQACYAPANGGEYDQFYIDTQNLGYSTVLKSIGFAKDYRENNSGWVYDIQPNFSGFIIPGLKEFCPVEKTGLNYNRSFFESGLPLPNPVRCSIKLNSEVGITGILGRTVGSPWGDVPEPVGEFPTPPGAPSGDIIFVSTAFSVDAAVLLTPHIRFPQDPPVFDDNPPEDEVPEEPTDFPSTPVSPDGPVPDITEYTDTSKIRAVEPVPDLKSRFRENARPTSLDYYTLVDNLYPPQYEAIAAGLQYRTGVAYVLSSSEVGTLTPGTYGANLISIETTASFSTYVSGVSYGSCATTEVQIEATIGLTGVGAIANSPIITIDSTGQAGRYDLLRNDVYVDTYGRVTQTRANTSVVAFMLTPTLGTTGAFNTFTLVDTTEFENCNRVDFSFGPIQLKPVETEFTDVGIKIGESSLLGSGYRSYSKAQWGSSGYSTKCFSTYAGIGEVHNRFFHGSITRLDGGSSFVYYINGMSIGNNGSTAVFRGHCNTSNKLNKIGVFVSATSLKGMSAAASSCKLFFSAFRGGVAVAPGTIVIPPVYFRRVFAWNILAQPIYGTDVADYLQEIEDAKSIGIDGFGVDLSGTVTDLGAATKLIQAAEASEFYLYPIINKTYSWTQPNIRAIITEFYNSSSGYRVNNKLVVGAYRGDNEIAAWWNNNIFDQLSNVGINCYFMPQLNGKTSSTFVSDYPMVEGGQQIATTQVTAAIDDSRTYYLDWRTSRHWNHGFSPSYWQVPYELVRPAAYYERRGGIGVAANYSFIINEDPNNRFITLCTWNDFGENTFWYPGDTPPTFTGNADIPVFTHKGFGKLAAYYNEWYKTKKVPTGEEFVVFSYRQHPAVIAPEDIPELDEISEWNRELQLNNAEDKIFVTTVLEDAAKVQIIQGETTVSADVTSGIQHVTADIAAGNPLIRVLRDDVPFMVKTGTVTIVTVPATTRNYNVYSDWTNTV